LKSFWKVVGLVQVKLKFILFPGHGFLISVVAARMSPLNRAVLFWNLVLINRDFNWEVYRDFKEGGKNPSPKKSVFSQQTEWLPGKAEVKSGG
jgi:hypothetical protein